MAGSSGPWCRNRDSAPARRVSPSPRDRLPAAPPSAAPRLDGREFAPFAAIELTPTRLRPKTAPLLEEKGNLLFDALIAHLADPLDLDRSGAWPGLAPGDHPVDPTQIHRPHGADQRLDRQETHVRRCCPQMTYSPFGLRVLHRHATPDMLRYALHAVAAAQVITHQGASLREHLKHVPIGGFHRVEDLVDEGQRNVLMKEVAH